MPFGHSALAIKYHKQKSNCFLYSVNSFLAHYISEQFYKGAHYVWCAPSFNSEANNPPSSNPKDILFVLHNDVARNDKNSLKIKQNKLGLIRGVEAMLDVGVITQDERDDILLIIEESDIKCFYPLLYIIDKNLVGDKIEVVPRKDRANIISEEVLIRDLHTDEFDVLFFH